MAKYYFWGFLVICSACSKTDQVFDIGASDASFVDSNAALCQEPNEDWDEDGIPNGTEGCLLALDTDLDGTPDWKDQDSDNDGIVDQIEAGEKDEENNCEATKAPNNSWPCDTDADELADYVDVDSDNDDLLDKDEDINGDGLLGCCLSKCNELDQAWQQDNCLEVLTDEGCGPGQKCENNDCIPGITFNCSNGETSPRKKDTFLDGVLDTKRGTFICRDATEDRPQGRKEIKTYKSSLGDWNIALNPTAKYNELSIPEAEPKQAAAIIDEDDSVTEVAAFVASRDFQKDDLDTELKDIISAFQTDLAAGTATVTLRASGVYKTTHDGFDVVSDIILDLSLGGTSDVSNVRNDVIASFFSRSPGELGTLSPPFGTNHVDFVLRMVVVKRVDTSDPSDSSAWRLVIMGAVAAKLNYEDPARPTGVVVDDLSNGTALATESDTTTNECDVATIENLPTADIIWVVDESGSVSDIREEITTHATNFFSRAIASGLDFRMGVTNICMPFSTPYCTLGRFCSRVSTDEGDSGGIDRFLFPTEQKVFASCVKNPPGHGSDAEAGLVSMKEAILTHLPRIANTTNKIRPGASLVVILITDEVDFTLKSIVDPVPNGHHTCKFQTATQNAIDNAVLEYIDLLSGVTEPEAAAIFHLIGGICYNTCNAEVTHGYLEVAQALHGQIGDLCQKDLGPTLQVIIDDIVGVASPVKLDYVPISISLAVAVDGTQVERSRTLGFDYRASANSIVLLNTKLNKGSEVTTSYKRWKKQVPIF